MAKIRALGADATLIGVFETAYGVAETSGYKALLFKSSDLGAEKPLGYDPLLGQGRDRGDSYYDPETVNGNIPVPVDVRGFGFWLKALLGAPVTTQVKAQGKISFTANPSNGHTITLNGTTWTFVTSSPSGPQTEIGVSLAATLAALVTNLNASADAEVAKVTYSENDVDLLLSFDTAGLSGNAYTLAASHATVSGATLKGGGFSHVFKSGGDLPSADLQIGHPKLVSPAFYLNTGVKANTLEQDFARSGRVTATIGLIAQGETKRATTIDASAAAAAAYIGFNASRASIKLDGEQLANVTGGKFSFSNDLEPVETIRDDGLIDGVDEGEAAATGSITLRFANDADIETVVSAETPVELEFGYTLADGSGYALSYRCPRCFLPKKKKPIPGPKGIEVTYDWQAAKDPVLGAALEVILVNDVATY